MKKFENLLGYTQEQLKTYLSNFLCGIGYKISVGDGYVFAKGDVPVLLLAHMDTARKEIPKTIIKEPTLDGVRIVAEDSIVGGDDRCGCWMIMNIIKKVKCSVVFLEDEEIGCVGARKFAKTEHAEYIKDNISFMIELDRRGSNDCVFYSNDNRDFVKYIEEKTNTKEAIGSTSDISVLMKETGVAGVNLSCGYYKEHTKDEYVVVSEMENMMNRVIDFLENETEYPKYEYKEKKYTYRNYSSLKSYGKYDEYDDFDDWYSNSKYYGLQKSLKSKAKGSLKTLCLTAIISNEGFEDEFDNSIKSYGNSSAECWAKLFMDNEDLCFSMIEDYYFD